MSATSGSDDSVSLIQSILLSLYTDSFFVLVMSYATAVWLIVIGHLVSAQHTSSKLCATCVLLLLYASYD
jgi:hypothetical protein